MADPRVLIDVTDAPVVGAELLLTGPPAHHLVRVLRIRPGDAVTVFDGSGSEWRTTVSGIDGRRLVVRIHAEERPERECPVSITLFQGLCRGERMDLVVQKTTELGAARIIAVSCDRSTVKLDEKRAAKRLEHWRGVSISASEQSGRVRVPAVSGPIGMDEALADRSDLRLALVPTAETRLTAHVAEMALPESIALLIGPEGGFSDEELDALGAAGWVAVALGPRILRTETAGIVALAAVQAGLGLI
jgi:16S rRNA (uracil1498-N3)-methyltransferase